MNPTTARLICTALAAIINLLLIANWEKDVEINARSAMHKAQAADGSIDYAVLDRELRQSSPSASMALLPFGSIGVAGNGGALPHWARFAQALLWAAGAWLASGLLFRSQPSAHTALSSI
ncbi:hypothetical protein [Actomonas aquatica]|uniref:Uncharacterized protein n=1 Tax=Actomonas aquatica TaxID=2866162 RepID=A0ABZ1CDZ7_9BACT|nr:hypothetical protein [Opitutus sp. WL0086]WRQ89907.1 hypothetical protein K1X11_010860 [Opitutus sp. WL0086]